MSSRCCVVLFLCPQSHCFGSVPYDNCFRRNVSASLANLSHTASYGFRRVSQDGRVVQLGQILWGPMLFPANPNSSFLHQSITGLPQCAHLFVSRVALPYLLDWIVIIVLIAIAGAFSFVAPKKRVFSLSHFHLVSISCRHNLDGGPLRRRGRRAGGDHSSGMRDHNSSAQVYGSHVFP